MSKPRFTSQAGFTLIEVGMASLILVVGFIGMIQALTIGSQMLDTSQKQQIAMQIIDGEIEKRRAGAFTAITSLTASTTYSITVNSTGTSASGNTGQFALSTNTAMLARAKNFTCSVTRTNIRTNFEKLVYTVTWTGTAGDTSQGLTYSRTMSIYFGLNGLQLSYQKS